MIADGLARVCKEGQESRQTGPGEAFGEIALMRRVLRKATVIGVTRLASSNSKPTQVLRRSPVVSAALRLAAHPPQRPVNSGTSRCLTATLMARTLLAATADV